MAWYGDELPRQSMRALVADLDGEIIGIAGLVYHDDQMLAFSSIKDEMRRYPVTIMKAAKRFADIINKHGRNVVAVASCGEKNSDEFLSRVGFEFIGETRDGRLYKWRIQ